MNFRNFVKTFTEQTKNIIAYFESYTELSGEQKKIRLDKQMTDWSNTMLEKSNLNLITKFIIKNFIISNIPAITQAIFDLIKAKVKGITE